MRKPVVKTEPVLRLLGLLPVFVATGLLLAQIPPDRCLVPPSVRDPILQEFSGEQAFLHVQMLSGTRDRQAEEYQNQFFETTYIRDLATQSGLSDVHVEFFPSRDAWDAEEGDLWLVQPVQKKIASLNQVPSSLASGSMNADVEAEVVYVGAGREADYAGKDVTGKIVLGSGSVERSLRQAASTSAERPAPSARDRPGVSGNAAGYTPRPDRLGERFSQAGQGRIRIRPVAAAVPRAARLSRTGREGRRPGACPGENLSREDERDLGGDSRDRSGGRRTPLCRPRLRDDQQARGQRQLHRRRAPSWRSAGRWPGSSGTARCRSRAGRSVSSGATRSPDRRPS